MVGEGFRFGFKAKGDTQMLAELCDKHGLSLIVAPLLGTEAQPQSTASSSRVRPGCRQAQAACSKRWADPPAVAWCMCRSGPPWEPGTWSWCRHSWTAPTRSWPMQPAACFLKGLAGLSGANLLAGCMRCVLTLCAWCRLSLTHLQNQPPLSGAYEAQVHCRQPGAHPPHQGVTLCLLWAQAPSCGAGHADRMTTGRVTLADLTVTCDLPSEWQHTGGESMHIELDLLRRLSE